MDNNAKHMDELLPWTCKLRLLFQTVQLQVI